MSNLLEVLITSDSNNTLWTSSIWDPNNGTNLMTYKGGGTAENRTLSLIGKDYLAAVEKTKPILHVWPLNSHQTMQGIRFILPGKATAFSVSPDGFYCIAGIEEKIYLWQIASGNLLTIINRHYQTVNLLKFTTDGRFFVSSADDGMIMVWSLTTVAANPEVELASQTTAGQHDPVFIFSDHTLAVTDLCISKTGMHGRLFTASSDRTSKIYDLSTGEMLLNLVFDEPLTSISLDALELNLFVGTSEGKIYQYCLTNPPRNRDLLINNEVDIHVFSSHSKSVNCLSASINGEVLMSSGQDGQVILWHIKSRQPMRTIKHKGPVTNAFFTLNKIAIYKETLSPSIILHSLERSLANNGEANETEVLVNRKINFWPQLEGIVIDSSSTYKALEVESSKKEEALKKELNRLKMVNANLFSMAIKKTLDIIPLENNYPHSNKKRKNKKQNK